MTFKKWSLAVATLMLVAPLSASALGISIASVSSTGASTSVLAVGDIITFDLVLENATNELVQGLGLGVYGYDVGAQGSPVDNRLQFAGGSTGPSIFNSIYVPSVGVVDGIAPAGSVREDGVGFPISDPLRVNLFEGVNFGAPSSGDGSQDNGVSGLQTNGSDVHMTVSFRAAFVGSLNAADVTLVFGTGQFGNEAIGPVGTGILAFNNAQYTLSVIPEPGTALLMGLGLAGLASARRR